MKLGDWSTLICDRSRFGLQPEGLLKMMGLNACTKIHTFRVIVRTRRVLVEIESCAC